MTGAQALDLLMLRYGNRTAVTTRANSLTEMVYQQTLLELGGELPWFLIGEEEDLIVTAGNRVVPTTAGFLREVEDIPLFIINNAGKRIELEKKDFYELSAHWTMEATSDLPENYAIVGPHIHLFPIPLVDTVIKSRTYKKQVSPTDDSSTLNLWLQYAPDLLIALTGEQIAMKLLKDPELTQSFMLDKTAAFARMIVDNTARTEAGRARAMG